MKKSLLFVTLSLFLIVSLSAQSNFNANTALQANSFQQNQQGSTYLSSMNANSPLGAHSPSAINHGEGMRNAGIILTAAGGVVLTGAIALIASAGTDLDLLDEQDNANVGRLVGGILLIPMAVGLLVPGTILLVKGSKKVKNSGGVSLGTNGTAASLRYTF